jgi:hypothetical protein
VKTEFVEHSMLIFSSSVLDHATIFSPRSKICSPKVYFSAAC